MCIGGGESKKQEDCTQSAQCDPTKDEEEGHENEDDPEETDDDELEEDEEEQDEEEDCPKGHGGNPIFLTNGNKYQQALDYTGPGSFPLKLERFYNSASGYWRHSYEYALQAQTQANIQGYRLTLADGKSHFYTLEENSQTNFTSTSHPTSQLTKVLDQDTHLGWRYQTRTGSQYDFDSLGRLTKIRTKNGRTQTLSHNNNQITITDQYSNTLTLTLNTTGKLASAQTNGLTFSYDYDEQDRLHKITYPDATTEHYHYEDPRYPKHLTGITDEANIRYASFLYDRFGRAILSEHANSVNRFRIKYHTDGTVSTFNALNKENRFELAEINGIRKIIAVNGQASNGCAAADQARTYHPNGRIATRTDWKGVQTQYEYNTRNLLSKRIEAFGTPEQREYFYEYHPTLPKLTKKNSTRQCDPPMDL